MSGRLHASEGRVWERLEHTARLFSLRHHRALAVHFNELGREGGQQMERDTLVLFLAV